MLSSSIETTEKVRISLGTSHEVVEMSARAKAITGACDQNSSSVSCNRTLVTQVKPGLFSAAQLPPNLDAEALEVLARRRDAGDSAAAQVWGSHQQLRVCPPVVFTVDLQRAVDVAYDGRGILWNSVGCCNEC